jgi:hypothetical protein
MAESPAGGAAAKDNRELRFEEKGRRWVGVTDKRGGAVRPKQGGTAVFPSLEQLRVPFLLLFPADAGNYRT